MFAEAEEFHERGEGQQQGAGGDLFEEVTSVTLEVAVKEEGGRGQPRRGRESPGPTQNAQQQQQQQHCRRHQV